MPLARRKDVDRQTAIGDRMSKDAIREALRADHPPVICDSRDQSHLPERTVLRRE